MRITSIELAGTSDTKLRDGTPGLPRAFARIGRKPGDEYITVEILTSGGADAGDRTHHVQADCEEDIRSMADALQQILDGYDGTNSEIEEYVRVLQHFAD